MKIRSQYINILFLFISAWFLVTTISSAQDFENGETVICEDDVIVQADDWLSKIADKYFGNVLAYPAIVEATNSKSGIDDSYHMIENPDVIEPGWKLCVPSLSEARVILNNVNLRARGLDIPAPRVHDYNQLQFIWEWDGLDTVRNINWYFDIKLYDSVNVDIDPYQTIVVQPEIAQYFNGKWYADYAPDGIRGCSYWVVQIAEQDASGTWIGHVSPESERRQVGYCLNSGSPVSR